MPIAFEPGFLTVATAFFVIAVLHTFLCQRILAFGKRFPPGGFAANLCHFLGEVEVVFGFWAALLVAAIASRYGTEGAVSYLESVNFTEPVFVFVVMCMAATRPVLQAGRDAISLIAKLLPLPRLFAFFLSALIVGPLLGSVITEPAAMTITALLLKEEIFDREVSNRFRYVTLGLLFVNISIGGTLTHYAAPPVIMVAAKWGWGVPEMMALFGFKTIGIVTVSTAVTALVFKGILWREALPAKRTPPRDLEEDAEDKALFSHAPVDRAPLWLVLTHLVAMGLVIAYHTRLAFFVPLFLLFIGWTEVTKRHQAPLKIRESLLVGFFLGGLVVLGKLQGWWIQPVLQSLSPFPLFTGTTVLTAVTDNAALTYLGSLVPDLSPEAKYALVAGAVTGGGLTVIANAPNPAGYGILQDEFDNGISPLGLLLGALPYTVFAFVVYWVLRPA